MDSNRFLISDASYSYKTKCAGLGVVDLSSGKKYSSSISNIATSSIAEYRALLLSVQIALKKKYENVVFVYDNKELDLDPLKLWLIGKIETYQFLWLKREYVQEADKLANKARLLQEKLFIKPASNTYISDTKLVAAFRKYSRQKILRAFMSIATKNEYLILKTLYENGKHPPVLVEESSLDFYSDIYNLLKKQSNKKSFVKYIDKNYPGTLDRHKFCNAKPESYYKQVVKKIINKLDELNRKNDDQK